ncbi:signal peptidase I [Pseudochelatococcus contaminans]|uniref:Signal peptidase I n=1 Tax=Pseudochelatococcus contaminans TaxID=1538103 RepID=A0A7W5Z1L2_9HYPH|nr:signal peptidase I [Pseudochelatococcus contaminans]MBB3808179.1 signal peptidase I [Pseudochelatococcus contaminans]
MNLPENKNPPDNKLPTPKPGHDQATPTTRGSGIGDVIKVVLQALLVAFVIRVLLFQPFMIPSGSMIPTLLVGDYLFVSKFSYGYSRYSLPWQIIPFNGRIWGAEPKRGDVAVFASPTGDGSDYVKRVIGLPGDTVQMVDNVLVINGERVKRERVGTFPDADQWGKPIDAPLYRETLPGGVSYVIMEREGAGSYWANTFLYKVPEGHYFMMGDNRDNSVDSRDLASLGYVPLENFIGRADTIFFSLDENTPAWKLWQWPSAVRWDRVFTSIR